MEEMVEARDRIRAARATKDRPGLPPLVVGDLVVGQHPKSGQWTLAGEVSAATHGGRAYWVKFHEGGGRLFARVDLKLDKSGVYGYTVQEMRQLEELRSEWGNPAGPEDLPGDEEKRETRHAGHAWRRLGRTTGTGGRGRLGAVRTWPVWAGVSTEDRGWRRPPLLRNRERVGH